MKQRRPHEKISPDRPYTRRYKPWSLHGWHDYERPAINAPQDFVAGEVLEALNEGKEEGLSPEANWWEGLTIRSSIN